MAIEFSKATEIQKARAVEIGLQLAGLGRKKSAIQTARANAEVGWSRDLAAIAVEEGKLAGELNDIGETLVTEK
jgi:hypothetical protein